MSDINAFIDNEVKSNDVLLFMKGTPTFPQCGFSAAVVQVLRAAALILFPVDEAHHLAGRVAGLVKLQLL